MIVARHHAERAIAGAVPPRRRGREPRRGVDRPRGREHRQADPPDPQRRDPADGRPDPLLRHGGPPSRGQERRRVHAQHDVVHPPRTDRRLRPGGTVELPDDDGRVEVRAGAGRRQHRRAEAQRHDAGQHDVARRDRRRVLPGRRVQRGVRRPRHRAGDGAARHPGDGQRHRFGARRARRLPQQPRRA